MIQFSAKQGNFLKASKSKCMFFFFFNIKAYLSATKQHITILSLHFSLIGGCLQMLYHDQQLLEIEDKITTSVNSNSVLTWISFSSSNTTQ